MSVLYYYLGKGQKLRDFCQDETRLGLKTISGKLLTLKGIKPFGKVQWKRDNFYLYGAVEPLTGESFFYEFSHLDTECFQLFVNKFSDIFPDSVNFMQVDNAKCHYSIDWPENVIPIFQPSYSPELNPIERFWEELKSKLRWLNFSSLYELKKQLSILLNSITSDAHRGADLFEIASIVGWKYITEAVLSAAS